MIMGGVLVSTNRVYEAPADGYQKRIEVPLEMCNHPSFTLYVKTFNPQLYAMFWIYGYGTDCREVIKRVGGSTSGRYTVKERPMVDSRYGVLAVDYCVFNPFGERVLELDVDAVNAMGPEYEKELLRELERHRYPLRPNVAARIENAKRRIALIEEIQKYDDWWLAADERRAEIIQRIASVKQVGKSDELKKHDEEVAEVRKKMFACYDELRRLEKEAQTLNLPPGMTEKDTYPKKTQ